MTLEVERIRLGYGPHTVIDELSFTLQAGEIGCLLGASGCGKTTALRAVAGFEPLRAGAIRIAGQVVSSPSYLLAPEHRSVGMVFQHYALFPHLNVRDNVAFGIRRLRAAERRRRIAALLELTGLSEFEERFVHQLSGGQQQRVALARALAPEPKVLLLDEPFSNLDTGLRRQVGEEIRHILIARGTATLLVTHDQQEAFALADRVGLLKDGRMLQWDTPYQLYHRPACRYVAAFTGRGSYLPARVSDGELCHALGRSPLPTGTTACEGARYALLIRPDDIRPAPDGQPARVIARQFQGADILYRLRLADGEEIGALFPSHDNYALDEMIGVVLDADHLVLFEPQSEDSPAPGPAGGTSPVAAPS